MKRLPYTALGEGPPVVLLHGLGGFKESWGRLPHALAGAGRRVYAPDLPGSGDAPRPRRPVSSASHATALAPWIAALGTVDIIGHSLGAQVALRLAVEVPGAVRSLTLLAPMVVPWGRHAPRSIHDLLAVPVVGRLLAYGAITRVKHNAPARRARLLAVVGDPTGIPSDGVEERLLEDAVARLGRADLRAFTAWASSGLRDGALRDAATIDVPVLTVIGERDPLTPPAAVARLRRVLGNRPVVSLPRVGRFPFLEAPDVTFAPIITHLTPRTQGAGAQ
ncbi:MAG TPA: alpha/beta hydrolase [Miltoncostaeaceae bacterium]|nr:alpha/beta hydrolase [Miltoncostaeaceae bacterium]